MFTVVIDRTRFQSHLKLINVTDCSKMPLITFLGQKIPPFEILKPYVCVVPWQGPVTMKH